MIRTDTVNYVKGEGGHMGLMAEKNKYPPALVFS